MYIIDKSINEIDNFKNAYDSSYLVMFENFNNTEFWIKEFSTPEMSAADGGEITFTDYSIKTEHTRLDYGNLDITFNLDEKHKVLEVYYNWLQQSLVGEDYEDAKSYGVIAILNSKRTEIVMKYKLYGVKPINITPLLYKNIQENVLNFTVSFSIDKFVPDFE